MISPWNKASTSRLEPENVPKMEKENHLHIINIYIYIHVIYIYIFFFCGSSERFSSGVYPFWGLGLHLQVLAQVIKHLDTSVNCSSMLCKLARCSLEFHIF